MKNTGTIEASDGSFEYVSVEGSTYEQARELLFGKVPEGHRRIVIRT